MKQGEIIPLETTETPIEPLKKIYWDNLTLPPINLLNAPYVRLESKE